MTRMLLIYLYIALISIYAYADTPPPGTVKAKVEDGTGTPITSTLSSGKQGLDVNIVNSGGLSTVDQGNPNGGGANAWWVQGSLGRTWSLLNTTDSVNAVQSGAWTVGRNWNLSSGADSVAVSGAVSVSNFPPVQAVSQSGTWTIGQGSPPWDFNLTQLSGSSFSATNYLPSRLTNGTTYVDPTQIRALSSGTDSVAITAASLPLPSGAATSALQTTGNSSLSSIDSKTPALGQALAAGSVPVVLTAAQLTTLTPLTTVAVTQSTSPWVVSGTVTANAGTNLNTSALALEAGGHLASIDTKLTSPLTISLPTNAATESSLAKLTIAQGTSLGSNTQAMIGGSVTTNQPTYTTGQISPISLNVRGAARVKTTGYDSAQLIRNDYSSTNVTTAAYVQLVASTSADINRLMIFDSSGQDFVLATGGAGSEVDQVQISPGGWDSPVDIFIASGTRISIKAKSATASSGILLITGLK